MHFGRRTRWTRLGGEELQVITPGDGQLSISLGGHEWVDAAVSGAIGLVAAPPVLLGTAYGIWKENRLDQEFGR